MTRQTGEWGCGDLTPEDFPAGPYHVRYRTHEKRWYFGQSKIRLDFVIVEPAAYLGLIVSLYCTFALNPNKRHSRASNWYKLWMQAHGGPPQRGQRMTPSVFEGYWDVEVIWGCNNIGEPTIPKIHKLLERVVGGGAA